jgi:hypothetical protein
VTSWFERYAVAFDADALSGFFVAPRLMVGEQTGAVFLRDEEAVRGNMTALCDYHRASGYERALVRDLRVQEASPSCRFATVDWRIERGAAAAWEFTNTYQPLQRSGEWRVLVSTTHGPA